METLTSRGQGKGLVIRKVTCGGSGCPDSSTGSFTYQLCDFESSLTSARGVSVMSLVK